MFNSTESLYVFFATIILLFIAVIWIPLVEIAHYVIPSLIRKREKENEEKRKKDEQKTETEHAKLVLYQLASEVPNNFGVKFSTINEIGTQEEIIRVVNLAAYKASEACMNQDKVSRGEKIEPYIIPKKNKYSSDDFKSWDEMAHFFKIEWSKKRQLALQICPNLIDKLPHFSQVEPLKSYNEKYIQNKRT